MKSEVKIQTWVCDHAHPIGCVEHNGLYYFNKVDGNVADPNIGVGNGSYDGGFNLCGLMTYMANMAIDEYHDEEFDAMLVSFFECLSTYDTDSEYMTGDVVINNGIIHESLIDENTDDVSNTDSWITYGTACTILTAFKVNAAGEAVLGVDAEGNEVVAGDCVITCDDLNAAIQSVTEYIDSEITKVNQTIVSEVNTLNNTITSEVSTLNQTIDSNAQAAEACCELNSQAIANNTQNIQNNTTNIQTNTDNVFDLNTQVTTNTSDIASLTTTVSDNAQCCNDNNQAISDNTNSITQLSTEVDSKQGQLVNCAGSNHADGASVPSCDEMNQAIADATGGGTADGVVNGGSVSGTTLTLTTTTGGSIDITGLPSGGGVTALSGCITGTSEAGSCVFTTNMLYAFCHAECPAAGGDPAYSGSASNTRARIL